MSGDKRGRPPYSRVLDELSQLGREARTGAHMKLELESARYDVSVIGSVSDVYTCTVVDRATGKVVATRDFTEAELRKTPTLQAWLRK